MNAPADKVWDLLSDVTKIGLYSPETFEAQWLDGATGPAVGARFRGHVKRNGRGPIYWTQCAVKASEPGREFTFAVEAGGRTVNTWSYKLRPAGECIMANLSVPRATCSQRALQATTSRRDRAGSA